MLTRLFSICLRFFKTGELSSPTPVAAPEETFLANATLLVSYAHQELQQFRVWTSPSASYRERARNLQRELKQIQQELKILQEEYRSDQQQARIAIERQHPASTAALQG